MIGSALQFPARSETTCSDYDSRRLPQPAFNAIRSHTGAATNGGTFLL
jgi:hypothetical protein